MKKDAKISFRLTKAERELLQKRADNAGMTLSEFILHCVDHWYEVSWNEICPVREAKHEAN